MIHPSKWLSIKKEGIYCIPGQFYIDPIYPVQRAIITHGHSDHAREGHHEVIAHTLTTSLMQLLYSENAAKTFISLNYYERKSVNQVEIYLLPAGHILGSAQVVIEYSDTRLIITGDYKRAYDPTCEGFVIEQGDFLITEATFGLPIFRHPSIEAEINKLLISLQNFAHRCHLVGVYGLGKCQRLIKSLRIIGYAEPIYIHENFKKICDFYESTGIDLGELRLASTLDMKSSQGKIVLCPPYALYDKWNRKFSNIVIAMASGWMRIRARAKQKGIELPLIISDHADWPELTTTIKEINPQEIWITHGREDALAYYANQQCYKARALHLIGNEDSED